MCLQSFGRDIFRDFLCNHPFETAVWAVGCLRSLQVQGLVEKFREPLRQLPPIPQLKFQEVFHSMSSFG